MTERAADAAAEVLIAGAGLSGLCCALHLQAQGVPYRLFDASDSVGGRVRTDTLDGFLLDRGFQVFLDAYPEAKRMLQYDELELRPFEPGSMVFTGKHLVRVADPRRRPTALFQMLSGAIAGPTDALKTVALKWRTGTSSQVGPSLAADKSTLDALREMGFSSRMIERFWLPFLRGIFLEPELRTSRRMFDFVFAMFSQGSATLPAEGMGAIPRQLAAGLDASRIHLGCRVERIEPNRIQAGDRPWTGRAAVVATDAWSAASLVSGLDAPNPNGVYTFYFSAPRPPYAGPWLVLNGSGTGQVNNVAVLSNVSASYAPEGTALISVSVLDAGLAPDEVTPAEVQKELATWFGEQVQAWTHLKTYALPQALPAQEVDWLDPIERPVRLAEGLFVCGDHRDNASIQGAMVSGRRAAEAVLADTR